MKTVVYCSSEKMLDAFKFGVAFANPDAQFTQSVDREGYWLLIEDKVAEDSVTYTLDKLNGLVFKATGVEV